MLRVTERQLTGCQSPKLFKVGGGGVPFYKILVGARVFPVCLERVWRGTPDQIRQIVHKQIGAGTLLHCLNLSRSLKLSAVRRSSPYRRTLKSLPPRACSEI